jgi:hypothetical protein
MDFIWWRAILGRMMSEWLPDGDLSSLVQSTPLPLIPGQPRERPE